MSRKWSYLNFKIELQEEMDRHSRAKNKLEKRYETGEISDKYYESQLKAERYFHEISCKDIFNKVKRF